MSGSTNKTQQPRVQFLWRGGAKQQQFFFFFCFWKRNIVSKMPKSTNISKEPKVELFCAEMEFVILLKWSGDLGLHLQSAAHVSFKLLGYFLFNEMHLNVNFPSQVFFFWVHRLVPPAFYQRTRCFLNAVAHLLFSWFILELHPSLGGAPTNSCLMLSMQKHKWDFYFWTPKCPRMPSSRFKTPKTLLFDANPANDFYASVH